jgi:hypothetical protein
MAGLDVAINSFNIMYQVIFYILLILVLVSYKDISNRIKVLWYKRKHIAIDLIGSDRIASRIICKKKTDSAFEYDGGYFFINPFKAIKKEGFVVYTFVIGNAFGHDYVNRPKEYLKKMIEDCKNEIDLKDKKGAALRVKDLTEEAHLVFDEVYRTDARQLNEVLYNAQLSNKEVWEEVIKFFKNKNFITLLIITLIGIGIILLLSYTTYDKINKIQVCQQVVANTIKV